MKYAVLFPGQGSQYVGMGKSLYDNSIETRRLFDEASEVLGYDFASKCFQSSLAEISKVEVMLPAIFTVSVGNYLAFNKEIDLEPVCCAGHSLGEYAALVCANSLSFSDALKIICKRSQIVRHVAEQKDASMTVIDSVSYKLIEEYCNQISNEDKLINIACYNSENQVVVSGNAALLLMLEKNVIRMNGHVTPLFGSIPFHSKLVEEEIPEFMDFLKTVHVQKPKWKIYSNVEAKILNSENDVVNELTMQICRPVQWMSIMEQISKEDIDIILEAGPNSILSGLAKENHIDKLLYNFSIKSHMPVIHNIIKTSDKKLTDEKFVPTVITKCLAAAVTVPNKNWNNSEYEEGVVKPFEAIRKLQKELEKYHALPTTEQKKEALLMLKSVYKVKKVEQEEIIKRIDKIIRDTDTENELGSFVESTFK